MYNDYKRIKKSHNYKFWKNVYSSYIISRHFSPIFSAIYLRYNVRPNIITLHMILSGIIGSIFFSLDNIFFKTIGVIFIQLWFILDGSDGEVARDRKLFSTFGKELDYIAHVINHPFFGGAIIISLIQIGRNEMITFVIIGSLVILNLMIRNLYSFNHIKDLKLSVKKSGSEDKLSLKKLILFILRIGFEYPNFIVFSSLIYFVDYYYNTNFVLIYAMYCIVISLLLGTKEYIKLIKEFIGE